MHKKYYHHQSPWILPVNSSELQPNGEEYSGSITKKAFHNARKRHRRNKLKVLYSQLCSLLPDLNAKVNPKPTSFPYCKIVLLKKWNEFLHSEEICDQLYFGDFLLDSSQQSLQITNVVFRGRLHLYGQKRRKQTNKCGLKPHFSN
jgi:hypothetical protein